MSLRTVLFYCINSLKYSERRQLFCGLLAITMLILIERATGTYYINLSGVIMKDIALYFLR